MATFGFPFGKMVALSRNSYPDITVTHHRITSLKKEDGRLRVLQFDGQINPGNSGGPVLDAEGRVVGVSWATVRGAGMNFAIPVGLLAEFLASPGIDFNPPVPPFADRSKPASWTIKVQPPNPEAKLPAELSVSVSMVNRDYEGPRVVQARPLGNGEFIADVTPIPGVSGKVVAVDATIDGQGIHLEIGDFEFKVGDMTFLASEVPKITPGANSNVYTFRLGTVKGPISGLPKFNVRVGGVSIPVDLSRATSLAVSPVKNPPLTWFVEARVEVKSAGKPVAAVVKRVEFPDAPGVRRSRSGSATR